MILFLQQDANREFPVGYERRRRNIFDPEDDEVVIAQQETSQSDAAPATSEEGPTDIALGRGVALARGVLKRSRSSTSQQEGVSSVEPVTCARPGCPFKPRFDSIFCSDACGVSALETDLHKTLQYCSEIHPTLLRS
jgi:hypothetical protein